MQEQETPDASTRRLPASRLASLISLGVVALIAVAFGVTAFAAVALPGCESCHLAADAAMTAEVANSHTSVSCAECHVDTARPVARAKFGFYSVFGMWMPILDISATDVTVARSASCLKCHTRIPEAATESRGIRILHRSCAVGRECTDCHSPVGHGAATRWPRTATMSDCVRCHRTEKISVKCDLCHIGRVSAERPEDREFAVTHGPTWRQTHGMGDSATCYVCHSSDKCAGCHGPGVPHGTNFLESHTDYSTLAGAKCLDCHDRSFCDSCHGLPMPHPASFTPDHSGIVRDRGEGVCTRCHADADCDTCHTKHVHPGGSVGPIPSPARERR